MAEIRSGKREGSVISTQTLDTTAQDGRETWEALRRELEDIGISPGVINEKRQFIVTWFQEAVAMGKLEEDASLDDNDSAMSLCKSNDLASTSDRDNVLQQHSLSVMPEPRSNIGSEIKGSMPGSQRSTELTTPPLLSARKGTKPGKVSFLFKAFETRDTVFFRAAEVGDVPLLRKSLDEGIDVNTITEYGYTALHRAAIHSRKDSLLMLLRNGAHVDSKTSSSGSTALFYAATVRLARILLDKEADINITNNVGITPLIVAVKSNRKAIVQLLLKNGAIISAVDNCGRTALKWAQIRHYRAVIRLLQEAEPQR